MFATPSSPRGAGPPPRSRGLSRYAIGGLTRSPSPGAADRGEYGFTTDLSDSDDLTDPQMSGKGRAAPSFSQSCFGVRIRVGHSDGAP